MEGENAAVATSIDPREFRRACGQFLTGVTIVTTRAEDGSAVGLTANSFTSVSLDPAMVLVCIDKRIGSYAAFATGRPFAVHILHQEQAALSTRFATKGADKFNDLLCGEGIGGIPLLPEYIACFECTATHAYDGGDHTIFVGTVARFHVAAPESMPLGFLRGNYAAVQQ